MEQSFFHAVEMIRGEAPRSWQKETSMTGIAKSILCLIVPLVLAPVWGGAAAAVEQAATTETTTATVLDRFSPDQRAILLKGKAIYESILEGEDGGSPSGTCKASILIQAPVDECFRRFAEVESHRLYFPRKTVSNVLEVRDGKTLVYKELDFKLKTIKYHILYSIDPADHRIDFELDKSRPADIKESEGFFHFIEIDEDTTLFDYGITKAELNIKVPGFVRRYLTGKDLPRVVTNYKRWMESGGTWKK